MFWLVCVTYWLFEVLAVSMFELMILHLLASSKLSVWVNPWKARSLVMVLVLDLPAQHGAAH